jgi:hypothetical protein
MSNGKLLTLFLDYENELRATMPDFAHQLSSLLNVPPKQVDYSNKAVAEYETFEDDAFENESYDDTSFETAEKVSEFHEDFEKNILFLMPQSDELMSEVYCNHYDEEENRDVMMAKLADNFSLGDLTSHFEAAAYAMTQKRWKKVTRAALRRIAGAKSKEELNDELEEAKMKDSKEDPEEYKKYLETVQSAVEDRMKELNVYKTSNYSNSDDDILSGFINEAMDTDVDSHCGVTKKKKKERKLIQLEFCESCNAEHADHFRFCDLCNQEHDGCCEVFA